MNTMNRSRYRRPLAIALAALLVCAATVFARPAATSPSTLPAAQAAEIDRLAREVLETTGVPSASVAVVRDGKIAYVQAYGQARLEPPTPARIDMRYSIGSISKQFTATAILMLAEEGKLSLNDPVSRFFPRLTRSQDVSIRQILSHTSGYQDYWPQDYVPPFMLEETSAQAILDRWAGKPLDFEPGTQYQYSNTGFVLAGLIVERAGGIPLLEFLKRRIFTPLAMTSVADIDQDRLGQTDPVGYLRYALGPPRVAPKEGKGWLFAAGELAMTAQDLARWNIGLIERRLLAASSYAEMERENLLTNGLGSRYGLGIGVASELGHRVLTHGGEVSGFTATNMIFPDDRAAISVLTNQDSADAASSIARRIVPVLFAAPHSAADVEARARSIFEELQQGKIDRRRFTANANSYFSEQAIRDFARSLGPLGKPQSFRQTGQQDRGGMTFHGFEAKFSKRTLAILERDMPDGKIEQYQVMARD